MSGPSRYSPEQRAKAARMVVEATPDYPSQWAAIESIADKIGASSETVRKWVRQGEVDGVQRPGLSSEEAAEPETRPCLLFPSGRRDRRQADRPTSAHAPSRPPSVVASAVYMTRSIMALSSMWYVCRNIGHGGMKRRRTVRAIQATG
jgi:transposase-like protein